MIENNHSNNKTGIIKLIAELEFIQWNCCQKYYLVLYIKLNKREKNYWLNTGTEKLIICKVNGTIHYEYEADSDNRQTFRNEIRNFEGF